jgi:hypothetical protein
VEFANISLESNHHSRIVSLCLLLATLILTTLRESEDGSQQHIPRMSEVAMLLFCHIVHLTRIRFVLLILTLPSITLLVVSTLIVTASLSQIQFIPTACIS